MRFRMLYESPLEKEFRRLLMLWCEGETLKAGPELIHFDNMASRYRKIEQSPIWLYRGINFHNKEEYDSLQYTGYSLTPRAPLISWSKQKDLAIQFMHGYEDYVIVRMRSDQLRIFVDLTELKLFRGLDTQEEVITYAPERLDVNSKTVAYVDAFNYGRKRVAETQQMTGTVAGKWLYHATSLYNLFSIAKGGLRPGVRKRVNFSGFDEHSIGKIFFASTPEGALQWHDSIHAELRSPDDDGVVRHEHSAYRQIHWTAMLIRVPFRDTQRDPFGHNEVKGSVFTTRRIPPNHIQFWHPQRGWMPLTDAALQDVDVELRTGHAPPIERVAEAMPDKTLRMPYVYHATPSGNLVGIYDHGLIPNGPDGETFNWGGDLAQKSVGKIFFSGSEKGAKYYSDILQSTAPGMYMVMLRVPSSALHDLYADPKSIQDYYVGRPIGADLIEVRWGEHGWRRLKMLPRENVEGVSLGEWDGDEELSD